MTAPATKQNAATFPEVLHTMISIESKRGQASPFLWASKGHAFVVEKKHPDLNKVVKKYFGHGRWSTIQRQLHSYGFKKNEGVFQLRGFQKNSKKESLRTLKRMSSTSERPKEQEKLGTKKRKVKRRNSEASECSMLIREAGQISSTNGAQDSYYYASDASTANENSTFAEELEDYNTLGPEEHQASKDSVHVQAGAAENPESVSGDVAKHDTKAESSSPPKASTSNKIKLPFSLKKIMIQTWENMSQKQLVYDLPSCMPIRKVLGMYVDAKVYQAAQGFINLRRDAEEQERLQKRRADWKNLADGIAMFFEESIRTRLLYAQEMPQLNAFLASAKAGDQVSHVALVDFYGVEHLLRLLLELPDILTECMSDDKARLVLQDIQELVKFLHRQQDYLFVTAFRHLSEHELEELK